MCIRGNDAVRNRLFPIHGGFGNMSELVRSVIKSSEGRTTDEYVEGVTLDLGMSSDQVAHFVLSHD